MTTHLLRIERCVCGLLVVHHYHKRRRLSCLDARLRHPRATVRREALRQVLAKAVRIGR